MRVLMFGWELPPHNTGGLGVACYGLACALLEHNVAITFVLPRKVEIPDGLARVRFADNATLRVKTVDSLLRPYVTSAEYERFQRTLETDIYGPNLFSEVLRYARAVEDIAQEEEFDLIHAHDWLSFIAGVRAKEITGKPLIVHVHATSYELSGETAVDERVFRIEQEGMQGADLIITVSSRTKDIVSKIYGIDPAKIEVVHNGTNAWEYQSSGREHADDHAAMKEAYREHSLPAVPRGYKMVLYAGRLTLHKGPDYFLRAARKVLEYEPNVLFVIAGAGDMEGQVIRQVAALGIADHVAFAGFARGEELNALYYAADLYVLPSVSEPFGMTPLESLVNGTPVLISRQAGVAEVLNHALKADFWDTEEMAHKMLMTIRHPFLARQLARHGCLEALALTWQKAALKCISLYRSLTAKSMQPAVTAP